MAEALEEQSMELEALEAIYMGDFEVLEPGPPAKFKIRVAPSEDAGEVIHVVASIIFTYTESYPDTAPEVEVKSQKGLPPKLLEAISDILTQQFEENLGMAMVYTACEAVREFLVENNIEHGEGSMYDQMMARQREQELKSKLDAVRQEKAREGDVMKVAEERALQEAEEERRRLEHLSHGTPCTGETFAAWRVAFEAEMSEFEDQRAKRLGYFGRPTGRQMFEYAKVNKMSAAEAAAVLNGDATPRATTDEYDEYDDDDTGLTPLPAASRAEETKEGDAAPINADLFLDEEADDGLDDLDDLDSD
mmetsp:Transcript_27553/g.88582  ORF Transcript_27553/g.88582 Transcript_27553/m.88582 type:complete len:306 (+) Transcript_27553:3-920(+)